MGRIWDFLKQDANAATDPLFQAYIRFALAHKLTMWIVFAVMVALLWLFVSHLFVYIIVGVPFLLICAYELAARLRRARD